MIQPVGVFTIMVAKCTELFMERVYEVYVCEFVYPELVDEEDGRRDLVSEISVLRCAERRMASDGWVAESYALSGRSAYSEILMGRPCIARWVRWLGYFWDWIRIKFDRKFRAHVVTKIQEKS